jgi:hypothetical protein
MTDSADQAWAALEARALRLLEHAKEVEPRTVVRSYGSFLRLWHTPAYGPLRTWTILQPGRKTAARAPALVREVAWERVADHQAVFEGPGPHRPAPSIGLREAALPQAELDALLTAGAGLAVPVLGVGHSVGVDAEYFGLETYEVSPNIRVQWCGAGPTAWRHFTTWVVELRGFLTRCLDEAK